MKDGDFNFVKTGKFYHVEILGNYAGKVERFEDWTVRGNAVRWQATKAGRVIGSAKTRREAAGLLRSKPL